MKKILEKQHANITVLIIPHGSEKTHEIRLNMLLVIFVVGVVGFLLPLSIVSILRNHFKEQEYSYSRTKHNKNNLIIHEINRRMKSNRDLSFELTDKSQKVFSFLKYEKQEKLENNFEHEIYIASIKDLGIGNDYVDAVFLQRETLNYLNSYNYEFEILKSSYLFDSFGSIPLGRPIHSTFSDTSLFGWRWSPKGKRRREFHGGTDMGAAYHRKVFATAYGIVHSSHYNSGYGNVIVIEHPFGHRTLYAHLTRRFVRKGQKVDRTTLIGTVGSTGRSTGPHLHYEVRIFNKPVDPKHYICTRDNEVKSKLCSK